MRFDGPDAKSIISAQHVPHSGNQYFIAFVLCSLEALPEIV
jgi:hypothetical protein